ncbi:MAG TPA: hypothetical protein PLT17_01505 [Chitinophagales bacterium]|nr:hypothetical protein [Chitinophagales bacterium]HRB92051.1 hypothetical protein [Chitinophagales bacterium]
MKFLTIVGVVFYSTTTFANEIGMNISNMEMYAPTAKGKSKSSGSKAFEGKGSKQISIGLGFSSYLGYFDKNGYQGYVGRKGGAYYYGGFFYSGTLSVQAEFGVHDYVGIGIVTGIGGSGNRRFYGSSGGTIYIPVGIIANFHFMQLIGDKKGVAVADKLDLYAGLNFGTGLAARVGGGGKAVGGMLFVGPQFGVKYFFTDKIGFYGEFGYGKSIFEAGVSIKL